MNIRETARSSGPSLLGRSPAASLNWEVPGPPGCGPPTADGWLFPGCPAATAAPGSFRVPAAPRRVLCTTRSPTVQVPEQLQGMRTRHFCLSLLRITYPTSAILPSFNQIPPLTPPGVHFPYTWPMANDFLQAPFPVECFSPTLTGFSSCISGCLSHRSNPQDSLV